MNRYEKEVHEMMPPRTRITDKIQAAYAGVPVEEIFPENNPVREKLASGTLTPEEALAAYKSGKPERNTYNAILDRLIVDSMPNLMYTFPPYGLLCPELDHDFRFVEGSIPMPITTFEGVKDPFKKLHASMTYLFGTGFSGFKSGVEKGLGDSLDNSVYESITFWGKVNDALPRNEKDNIQYAINPEEDGFPINPRDSLIGVSTGLPIMIGFLEGLPEMARKAEGFTVDPSEYKDIARNSIGTLLSMTALDINASNYLEWAIIDRNSGPYGQLKIEHFEIVQKHGFKYIQLKERIWHGVAIILKQNGDKYGEGNRTGCPVGQKDKNGIIVQSIWDKLTDIAIDIHKLQKAS